MNKCPDLRLITIDTYEKPIKKGPNGEEFWSCQVVNVSKGTSESDFYIYILEEEQHKLFNLRCSNLNAGPCDHWVDPEPILVGKTIWDLYDQMGKSGIFRKREDGLGYYHYL